MMRAFRGLASLLACLMALGRCAAADAPPTFTYQGTAPVYFWLSGAPDGQQSISVRAADGRVSGYLTYREHQVAVDGYGVTEIYDITMTAVFTGAWDVTTPGATRFVATAECMFLGREYFDGALGIEQAGAGAVPIELDVIPAGNGFQGTIHALDGGSMILLSVPQWSWDVSTPTAPPYYNPSVLVGATFSPFTTGATGPVQFEALDPLPSMADLVTPAGGLSAFDQERLATEGEPVSGPAADGATRLLLRVKLPAAGNVTFGLPGSSEYGTLTGLGGTGAPATTLTTATVPLLGAHYAFALYQAPDGLPFGSANAAGGIAFTVSAATDTAGAAQPTPLSLFLFQPPVVLLHGLWSDGRTWDGFSLNANGRFNWITAPTYPNAAPLAANVEVVRARLQDALGMARAQGVAACRVDVVGHSMGGLLARAWASAGNESAYFAPRNWYAGDMRRLITLDTPHAGSPLANAILLNATPTTDWIMRTVLHKPVDDGAVLDLCVGSQALAALGSSLVPSHALVGDVGLSVDTPIGGLEAQGAEWRSLLQGLPLVGWVSPLWTYSTAGLFGGAGHDFIVGTESQRGGLSGVAASSHLGYEFRHTNNTSSGIYAQECETLLVGPAGGLFQPFPAVSTLSLSGDAPPPGRVARTADDPVAPPTLTITAPPEGSAVTPGMGMMFSIEAPAGSTVISAAIVGNGAYAESNPIGPTLVTLTIPIWAAGDYTVVALAQLEDGQQAYSPPLHLQAIPLGAGFAALRFWQGVVSLEAHDTVHASCLVDYTDGVTRPLAPSTAGLAFTSTDPTIAAVDSVGNVTAVAPGWCLIQAQYAGLEASLVVTVRPPMPDFRDVPADFWAFSAIRAVLRAGIVQGYSDGTYHPERSVTRDQMAVYISRALAGGDGSVQVPTGVAEPTFTDVDEGHWAYRYVEYCYAKGIVQGYADGSYQPDAAVNRGQMAAYVARAVVDPPGDANVPEAPASGPTFADVTSGNEWSWCYRYVEYVAGLGIVQGYSDGAYHPEREVTRDQMAVYVARAFGLPM
jgi:hypothetical protein